MNRILIIIITSVLLANCKKQPVDINYLSEKFEAKMESIHQLQYNVQNIMTFSDGNVWNNKGFAIIEKDLKDTIFGFSFFGKRDDSDMSSIYKNTLEYKIYNDKNSFKKNKGSLHSLGMPGGQMIYKDIFRLETKY